MLLGTWNHLERFIETIVSYSFFHEQPCIMYMTITDQNESLVATFEVCVYVIL